jgi:CheY-like chemotaxis protein/class 3 adenylate cyclase/DNA-binding CsgD family transcriptional regulator
MSGELILIVEDNVKNLKLVRDLLRLKGYSIVEAETAERGLELATEQLPSLILMDIQLPDMDGQTALGYLKSDQRTAAIPVIALTAFAMNDERERFMNAGFDAYLSKPIDIKTFPDQIGSFLVGGLARPSATNHTVHEPVVVSPPERESGQPQPRVLVVDDNPQNVRVLEAMLAPRGYSVASAGSGEEALEQIARLVPDLVLLDVVMPGMDGFEVCREIRSHAATQVLPIIMVTARGDQEKVRALQAGADDFVQKPFDQAELLARVVSLVRIKRYHDTIQQQAAELASWNELLEGRVQEQVAELERLGRLRRFLSSPVAELLASAEGEALLESHRRQIAVVCCQLPGFSALAESHAPEEALTVLRAYHEALGSVISKYEATVGPLVEDRVMLLFNDPLPIDDPAGQAVKAALDMRSRMEPLLAGWRRVGYALDFTTGIDLGYATLGTIGFAGRTEYGAIGTVVQLASRLCEIARTGAILISQRVRLLTEQVVDVTVLGEQAVPGFKQPVPVFSVDAVRASGAESRTPVATAAAPAKGPLTEREREVVNLIARGYTNREIATELVIAEGTAVRHVANILNKLGLKSRAQVAVWEVERTLSNRS